MCCSTVVGVEVHKSNHIAEDRDIAEDEHEKHAGKNQKIQPLVADNIFLKRSQPLSSYAGFAGLAAAAIRYNLLKIL